MKRSSDDAQQTENQDNRPATASVPPVLMTEKKGTGQVGHKEDELHNGRGVAKPDTTHSLTLVLSMIRGRYIRLEGGCTSLGFGVWGFGGWGSRGSGGMEAYLGNFV